MEKNISIYGKTGAIKIAEQKLREMKNEVT